MRVVILIDVLTDMLINMVAAVIFRGGSGVLKSVLIGLEAVLLFLRVREVMSSDWAEALFDFDVSIIGCLIDGLAWL